MRISLIVCLIFVRLSKKCASAVAMVAIAVTTTSCGDRRSVVSTETRDSVEVVASTPRPSPEPAPALAPQPAEPNVECAQILVSAWSGQSALGYTRAELWVEESKDHVLPQELRVIHSDGAVRRHRGQLVQIPNDFPRSPGPWRAFILVPLAGERFRSPYPQFLATVNPQGVMRLYEHSTIDGTGAYDLQPAR